MRFRLTFELTDGRLLPMNYQYLISSWIYQRLGLADKTYANFLHEEGYQAEGKAFKLFTFSELKLPKISVRDDRFMLRGKELSLIVCLKIDQAATNLIQGVFTETEWKLGDKKSQVGLRTIKVETLPEPKPNQLSVLHTASPLVISIKEEGKRHAQYLKPDDPRFARQFIQNLLRKYQSYNGSSSYGTEDVSFAFIKYHKPASRLITIKAFTDEETKVRGYRFDFALTAPADLIAFGLEAGFGEYNANGFGCCLEGARG